MLYIRHGEKSYKNGQSDIFSLDPNLTDSGKEQAKDFFRSILNIYKIPPKIVSSPYLRARETAKIAHDIILEKTGKKIPILYDSYIGEYLGHQKNITLQDGLHPETLALNPIPHETFQQYSYRIRKHMKTATDAWYITHGMVLKSIAYFKGSEIDYPDPLGAIYINNGNITIH
jgi:broad specificity phosphatase PhoE